MQRVRLDRELPPAGTSELYAARSEYEPLQLLVTSASGEEVAIAIEVEDLVGDNGKRIDRSTIDTFEIGYIGNYPDVVYPHDAFTGDRGDRGRVFWILHYVPTDSKPGVYQGAAIVKAGGQPQRFPYTLTVWSFALPERTHFKTCLFSITGYAVVAWYGHPSGSPEYEELVRGIFDSLAQHRISPGCAMPGGWYEYGTLPIGTAPRRRLSESVLASTFSDSIYGEDALDYYKKWGTYLTACGLDLSFFPVGPHGRYAKSPETAIARERFWRTWYPFLKQHAWADGAYIRPFADEMKQWKSAIAGRERALAVKRLAPDIKVLATISGDNFKINDAINDVVDIWSISANVDDAGMRTYFRDRRAEGDLVCPYIHSAAILRYTGTNLRSFFWKVWRSGYDGCTYFSVNRWYGDPSISHYFRQFHNFNRLPGGRFEYRGEKAHWSGEGILFWPGPAKPLASVRLELIREGIEDFEYMRLLEHRLSDANATDDRHHRAEEIMAKLRQDFSRRLPRLANIDAARLAVGRLLNESMALAE